MPTGATIKCSRCGTPGTAGKKFCSKCGNPLAAAPARAAAAAAPRTSPARAPAPKPAAQPGGARRGLSIWWIVVPTAVFAFLSRDIVQIVIVAALGAALWAGKTKQIPDTADANLRKLQPWMPWLPALQIVVVFVMLGGSLIAVAFVVGVVIAAAHYHASIIPAMEPWWQLQSQIPPALRKPIAIGIAVLIGYYFGKRAGGQEWTYTLISVSFGILAVFLIVFTPPDSMRRTGKT